jgi:hypothetical protein
VSHRITCPHCAAPLRLPEGLAAAFGYCPRCQGKVPNPDAPPGDPATALSARPVFALDDDLGPETHRSNRGLLYLTLLLFFGVFFGGGLSGLIGSTQRGRLGGLDAALSGVMITLTVFAVLFLPVLLVWLIRARFVKRAAPDGYGRVVLIVVFWILFSAMAGAAAFMLFFLACLGGLAGGNAVR